MIPLNVSINKNDIIFRTGDEKVVYKSDVNAFLENTGVTIQNTRIPFSSDKVFYIKLSETNKTFNCGKSLQNVLLDIQREIDNGLLIIDFEGTEEVSQSFLKVYTQFLLQTSNKVITIGMSTEISSAFSSFIRLNITEDSE